MASHNNDDAPDQEQESEEVFTDGDDDDDDESYNDSDRYQDNDDDDEDSDQRILNGPNLLFGCQEGQFQETDRRFDLLVAKQQEHSTLEREIFQESRDGTTAMTEMLMACAPTELAGKVLEYALQRHPTKLRHALSLQSRSCQRRTALHWACYWNSMDSSKLLIRACPEAMLLKDDANRTPADLLQRYHCGRPANYELEGATSEANRQSLKYLQQQAHRWKVHRIRDTLYLGAQLYFSTPATTQEVLTPFCDKDRKTTKLMRRQWFIMSVLGSLIQREMKPLVWHILGYVNPTGRSQTKRKKKNKKQGNNHKSKKRKGTEASSNKNKPENN